MSKEDVEVQAQASPVYHSADEKNADKILEGSAALGGIERVQEYGYVERGYVLFSLHFQSSISSFHH